MQKDKSLENIFISIPHIQKFHTDLTLYVKALDKIALTGKVSSLHIAETLFDFIEDTKQELTNVKTELISNLIKENIKKIEFEITSRSRIITDILVRSLSERVADINFLGSDKNLSNFISNPDSIEIESILNEYIKKYTIYDDIAIFDSESKLLVKAGVSQKIDSTKDSIIKEALNSQTHIEKFRHSDIQPKKRFSLLYAKRILDESNNPAGVVVLCYKFENELNLIFNMLGQLDKFVYTLVDGRQNVIATSNKFLRKIGDKSSLNLRDSIKVTKYGTRSFLIKSAKSKESAEYNGIKWFANVVVPISAFNKRVKRENDDSSLSENSNILPKEVQDIKDRWDDIDGNLSDVIINGELIASRLKEYALNPVLDNIRVVSQNIYNTMNEAIDDIQSTIVDYVLDDVHFRASLAVDILDRSLYERANDCRWWSLNYTFKSSLKEREVSENSKSECRRVLESINSLYGVYSNIILFDRDKNIIASSTSISTQKIDLDTINRALSNRDSQRYFVTEFESSPFYENRATYIYASSILSLDNSQIVGGIATVLNVEKELKSMLYTVLPKDRDENILKNSFALFIEKESKKIIASTNIDRFKVGEIFSLENSIFLNSDIKSDVIELDGAYYCVGVEESKGYREFRVEDGYKNDILSIVFIKTDELHHL